MRWWRILLWMALLAPYSFAADTCPTSVDLNLHHLDRLPEFAERVMSQPTASEASLASQQDGILAFRVTTGGLTSVPLCGGLPCRDNPDGGSGDSFNGGTGSLLPIVDDQSCKEVIKRDLDPESFAKVTYWGKSLSSAGARIATAPERVFTHPSALLGDLVMVFVSPKIKQSLRNYRFRNGRSFGIHTVVTLLPARMLLNLSVSSLDAFIAYWTARMDNFDLPHEDAMKHSANRMSSNIVSYIVIDSLTAGIDDHLVLQRLIPLLVRKICDVVPQARLASLFSQGSVVMVYAGLNAGWETFHYRFIRGYLFQSHDPNH